MSEHAVTVLISRNVRAGCEADFERVTAALMQAASGFEGYLGAQLIHPGEDPEVEDAMYHIVLAFERQAHLDAWHESPERRRGLAATVPSSREVNPMSSRCLGWVCGFGARN